MKTLVAVIGLITLLFTNPIHAVCTPIKIMPLGDSITAGSSSGIDDPAFQKSYRKDLLDLLVSSKHKNN